VSATTGRVAQGAVEALHEQLPADAGLARMGQVAVEAVRDSPDFPTTPGRIAQVSAELAHDHIPADSGTARLAQLSVEVVRAVIELAVGASNSRVRLAVIAARDPSNAASP
jgi:hypothetical protein